MSINVIAGQLLLVVLRVDSSRFGAKFDRGYSSNVMRRNAPTTLLADESVFVTPAQRVWLERATDFSSSSSEIEDWSFLNFFSPGPEGTEELIKGEREEDSQER